MAGREWHPRQRGDHAAATARDGNVRGRPNSGREERGAGRGDFVLASDQAGLRKWDILEAKKQEMGTGRDDFIHARNRTRQREGAILNAAKKTEEGREAGRPTRDATRHCGPST